MDVLDSIEYGWVDKKGNIHIYDFDAFSDDYILQSPEEVMKSKTGVCWDQVELERELFKDYENVRTFFIVYYVDSGHLPNHTFLTYTKDNKYYWLENSWAAFKGVHKYNSIEDLLIDVRSKFIDKELSGKYDKDRLVIREYNKPKYGITMHELLKHCESGSIINLDK